MMDRKEEDKEEEEEEIKNERKKKHEYQQEKLSFKHRSPNLTSENRKENANSIKKNGKNI